MMMDVPLLFSESSWSPFKNDTCNCTTRTDLMCSCDASVHIPVFDAKELHQQVAVAKGNSASYCASLIDQHRVPLSGPPVT